MTDAKGNIPVHIGEIKKHSIENGDGIRVSVFISGCPHRCKGCHNPEAWAYDFGEVYTEAVKEEILSACAPDYIDGLTLLGGEPMAPHNVLASLDLSKNMKKRYPEKTIWLYTGYTMEELKERKSETVDQILDLVDVVVDGRFEEDLKVVDLPFRGSTNQRIIRKEETPN